jgi:DNA-binding LytR/AlgR family response regulator
MAGIKVMLVEDDWIISKEISYSLHDLGFDVAGTCDNGEEALRQIKVVKPDIVLLDIDLSTEMTGIDVAKKLKQENSVPFIFLTALADPGTIEKAKVAEPYAYLVKPVNSESLYSTIEITLHNFSRRHEPLPTAIPLQENLTMDDGIFVKANKRLEKILLRDVLLVEAYDIYAMIFTATNKHLLNSSLKVVEDKFPSSRFARVHRSYIVNIDKIEAIEENDLIINDKRIPVGKTYKDDLMRRLSFL